MKIPSTAADRRNVFDVETPSSDIYDFPYAKLQESPSPQDRLECRRESSGSPTMGERRLNLTLCCPPQRRGTSMLPGRATKALRVACVFIACMVVPETLLYSQQDDHDQRLVEDLARVRQERDEYRRELDALTGTTETRTAAALKVLSADLSQEIKEDFFSSVTRLLWVLALLVGIATAGGFWKLSGIISHRIDERVRAKEQDIGKLTTQIIDTLVSFKTEAAQALREVAESKARVAHASDSALSEMRTKALAVLEFAGASGDVETRIAVAKEVDSENRWFPTVPERFLGIVGSQFDELGRELPVPVDHFMGAFSRHFQEALLDPKADTDGDGCVSLLEAAQATSASLRREGIPQTPTIVGSDLSVTLFSLRTVRDHPSLPGRVVSALIGINGYGNRRVSGSAQFIPGLRGPINDINGFERMLMDGQHLLAREAVIHRLIDAEATKEGIKKVFGWLKDQSTESDIAVVYYSGHQATIPDGRGNSKKALVPYDFTGEAAQLLDISELLESLQLVEAKQRVAILDV